MVFSGTAQLSEPAFSVFDHSRAPGYVVWYEESGIGTGKDLYGPRYLGWSSPHGSGKWTFVLRHDGYEYDETSSPDYALHRSKEQLHSLRGTVSRSSYLPSGIEYHWGLSLDQKFLSSVYLADDPVYRTAVYEEHLPFYPRLNLNAFAGVTVSDLKSRGNHYKLITLLSGDFYYHYSKLSVDSDLVDFYEALGYRTLSFRSRDKTGFRVAGLAYLLGPPLKRRVLSFSQGLDGRSNTFLGLTDFQASVSYEYMNERPKFITYRFPDKGLETASGRYVTSSWNTDAYLRAELLCHWFYAGLSARLDYDLSEKETVMDIHGGSEFGVRGTIGAFLIDAAVCSRGFLYLTLIAGF